MKYPKGLFLVLLVALLSLPLSVVHAASGSITGKVTDPRGAAIPGASVTVTNKTTNQDFSTVTDAQGRYKVEGLTAGVYDIVIVAKGFKESRQADIKVEDNAVKSVDVGLEIAPVEAQVKVATGPQKGNLDPVYQTLRQFGKTDQDFTGPYAVACGA